MEFNVHCGDSPSSFQAAGMGLGGEMDVVEGTIQVKLLDRQNFTGVRVCVCLCVHFLSWERR